MVSANQASSVILCYDPMMKAGVKIQRMAMIWKIQLKIYKEQSAGNWDWVSKAYMMGYVCLWG